MIHLKQCQWNVFNSRARFRVLVAGRRFGKTFLSQVELIQAAWKPGHLAWYVAPTYKQAKRIAWKPLKEMTRPYWASKPNESDLRIELTTGGTIALRGADNYDSLRGDGLDFLVLDEYASMSREAWVEVLRPALADKQGRALFIGTPRGCNHFYDLYEWSRTQPDWAAFQYTTEEGRNVTRAELESATHALDERTYNQEFKARFEDLTAGLVYYGFDRTANVMTQTYDARLPLVWSLDFNVGLMCSVLGHKDGEYVRVLDELALPDSNTWAACDAFLARTEQWVPPFGRQLQVKVYGDATGNARDSSASRTDWQIVRDFFGRNADRYAATFHVRAANPEVKDRVNCVNARLRNQAGERRVKIDPRCKQLIQDFERVHWGADTNGNRLNDIDKKDPKRTHLSDALGYMITREFPMSFQGGERHGYIA